MEKLCILVFPEPQCGHPLQAEISMRASCRYLSTGSEACMKPLGNTPRAQVTSPRLLPRAAAAHRGACAEPQLRDKDARLISAGHKVDVAGDRPVKALGIRACHSRHRQVFISGSSCSQHQEAGAGTQRGCPCSQPGSPREGTALP